MIATENFYALSLVLDLGSSFGLSISANLCSEADRIVRSLSDEEREAAESVSFLNWLRGITRIPASMILLYILTDLI
jgi:hypothetical protein